MANQDDAAKAIAAANQAHLFDPHLPDGVLARNADGTYQLTPELRARLEAAGLDLTDGEWAFEPLTNLGFAGIDIGVGQSWQPVDFGPAPGTPVGDLPAPYGGQGDLVGGNGQGFSADPLQYYETPSLYGSSAGNIDWNSIELIAGNATPSGVPGIDVTTTTNGGPQAIDWNSIQLENGYMPSGVPGIDISTTSDASGGASYYDLGNAAYDNTPGPFSGSINPNGSGAFGTQLGDYGNAPSEDTPFVDEGNQTWATDLNGFLLSPGQVPTALQQHLF